jgi:hypothetical protein
MTTQETKRQHYVPETYLKRFGYERKEKEFQIGALNKDTLEKPFTPNTDKICLQTDLYTLDGETEEDRQIIENFYGSEIETNYDNIYSILTDDNIKSIDDKTKYDIIGFAITLLYRVTKWITSHNSFMKRVFEKSISLAESVDKDYFIYQDQKIYFKNKTIDDLIRDYADKQRTGQVISQLKVAIDLISLRKDDSISVVKISGDNNFITSDNPVVLYNFGSRHIAPFDPNNEIHLPLNSKYKLTIYPKESISIPNYISRISHKDSLAITETWVNNYEQYRNAERFLLGDYNTLLDFKNFKTKMEAQSNVKQDQTEEFNRLIDMAKKLGLI